MDSRRFRPMGGEGRGYFLGAVATAGFMAVLFIAFLFLAGFPEGSISPDGKGYVSVTDYFRGEPVAPSQWRISRPIVPLLALPLSYFVSTELSFLLVNALLFVVLVGVFLDVAWHLLGCRRQAFYAAMLLVFAFPVYYRGINVTVDLASWLIFVVTARVLIGLENRGRLTVAACSAWAALCALGTLVTELVLASFLLVFCFYLVHHRRKRPFRGLFVDLLMIGISFAAPLLALQLVIYAIFDYGIFDKARKQALWFAHNPLNLGVAGFVRVLVGAFLAALVFVPPGMLDLRRRLRHRELSLAMLVAALLTLAAVYTNSIRFVFVLFPLVFAVAVLGIVRSTAGGATLFRWPERGQRAGEVVLLAAICAFNLGVYAGVLRYGSTIEVARRFLSFLL